MRGRFLGFFITTAMTATAAGAVIAVSIDRASAQAAAGSVTAPAPALKTPWGEPDLQGIWTDETDTPLQRPPKYANQEFFTEAQRAELDDVRDGHCSAATGARSAAPKPTSPAPTTAVFVTMQAHRRAHVADRRSAQWPAAGADAGGAEDRRRRSGSFVSRCCKRPRPARSKSGGCAGGKYDPTPSPRRAELPPRYNTTHESP